MGPKVMTRPRVPLKRFDLMLMLRMLPRVYIYVDNQAQHRGGVG